jgi:hypothetical protein
MLTSILLAAAALLFSASAAFALTASARREAPGTPEQVWAVVSGFCAIDTWHPAIKKCVEKKNGDTVTRELTLADGGIIVEQQTGSGDLSYSYKILSSPLPVKNYSAKLWVDDDEDDPERTEIYWTATFDAKGVSDEEAKKTVTGILKSGVAGIKTLAIEADDKRKGITFTPPKVHSQD